MPRAQVRDEPSELQELRRRCVDLEVALRHARQIAEAERRSAALARRASDTAWAVATRQLQSRRESSSET